MSLDLDPDLLAELQRFRESQRLLPPKTEVLEVALMEFLQREGFYLGNRVPGRPHPSAPPPHPGLPVPVRPPIHLAPIPPTAYRLPVLGSVPAGPPAEAIQEPDEWIDFGERFTGEGRFGVRVKGTSMVDEGVLPGDVVVLRLDPDPPAGEIVVGQLGDDVTLKKLVRKTPKEVRLMSRDGTRTMLVLDLARGDRLLGVLVGVVRFR